MCLGEEPGLDEYEYNQVSIRLRGGRELSFGAEGPHLTTGLIFPTWYIPSHSLSSPLSCGADFPLLPCP